jgi:uncharacterized protein (DUF1800 family)
MRRLAVAAVAVGLVSAPVVGSLIGNAAKTVGINAATQVSNVDAARFLTQASFGPTDSSIAGVQSSGYKTWITQQERIPSSTSSLTYVTNRLAYLRLTNTSAQLQSVDFYGSFWKDSVTAPDQLRQRVKLALSEIFVVSFAAPQMDTRSISTYYDMLGKYAFGNYRNLLEQVALHPMMGVYLNAMGNAKEDPTTGRHPDENFAREIQQLMSIGLYKLNQDGTAQTDANGIPIPTYTISDIQGLAKVFTGYSWYVTDNKIAGTYPAFSGAHKDSNSYVKSMVAYPAYHSTSEKSFLGTTIPASATSNPSGDLKIALDTIFNHPNVGPFIGKQLIQRLVTSNPSPAYVSRVAAVFNNDGTGVRGNLGAVVQAILLDPEARDPTVVSSPNFGKLREPVVRMANWARAFNVTSNGGWWPIGDTSPPVALYQSTMNAPSVFNFWRPGFTPPDTTLGGQGLVAPEFQAVNEVSVAGWLNTMIKAIYMGMGPTLPTGLRDIRSTYSKEVALARNPNALIDRINLLLLYGQMSPGLRTHIYNDINNIPIPGAGSAQSAITLALTNRAQEAVFLTLASPEYIAQR